MGAPISPPPAKTWLILTADAARLTVTVIEQLAVLLQPSVTVNVTVVVPTGYVPDASGPPLNEFVTVKPGQLSPTVGSGTLTNVGPAPVVVTLPGQVIVGG